MARYTTFNELSDPITFNSIDTMEFGFGASTMTLMEMVGAILKGLGTLQDAVDTLGSAPVTVSLSQANLDSIANSVLAYDISDLDSDTTVYNLDNLVRASLLNATTNNHNSSGDTLTTLKTDGTAKTVFTKTTNKRGEPTGIGCETNE